MPTNLDETLRNASADLPSEAVIFGGTPAMREIRDRIESVRSSDGPVLIHGESGTGKEVIARFLHTRSRRREAPFVKLNCAAVPATLLDTELFGCEKDSLARASEDRRGLIEIADGGTLFLNEIGEMSLDLQDKLLRLLCDGTYTRIGGREERTGRMRVVCASNIHLQKAVDSGSFREDLFDRIHVVSLRLSPLRDRKNDIPQLCEYFLQKLSRQFRRSKPSLNAATLELLKQWDWPGNLRELENWVARAVILGSDEALVVELKRQLKPSLAFAQRLLRLSSLQGETSRANSAVSGAPILRALQANHWNRRKTAEDLKMSYRALLYKLRGVGIPPRRRSHGGPPRAH